MEAGITLFFSVFVSSNRFLVCEINSILKRLSLFFELQLWKTISIIFGNFEMLLFGNNLDFSTKLLASWNKKSK